jgi:hypothetical protein
MDCKGESSERSNFNIYVHKVLMNLIVHFSVRFNRWCHNLNIGFVIKCGMQGPLSQKMCLGVKHTLTNGGECKGWSPMTPKCTPTLGVAFV